MTRDCRIQRLPIPLPEWVTCAVALVLGIGVIATSAAVSVLVIDLERSRDDTVEEWLHDLGAEIELTVTDHLSIPRSVRSLIEVTPDLEAEGFARFATEVSSSVGSDAVYAVIWAESPTGDPGDVEITHIQSDDLDQDLIGFDLAADPQRRAAIAATASTGRPTFSRPAIPGEGEDPDVTLEESEIGYLIPIYLAVTDSDTGRFVGIVNVVFVADQLIASAAIDRAFSVVDTGPLGATEGALLFSSEPGSAMDGPMIEHEVLGRVWEVRLAADEVPSGITLLQGLFALAGLLLTVLAATIVSLKERTNRIANARAERLSAVARQAAQHQELATQRLHHGLRTAEIELWERDLDTLEGWSSGEWARGADSMFEEFLRRVHPDDRPVVEAAEPAPDGEIRDLEFRFLDVAGHYRWTMSRSVSVLRNGRRVLTGVQMDITDRRAAIDEIVRVNTLLKESNASLNEFTRVASHDLRSPLHGTLTLCQFIREDAEESLPEPILRHLTKIEERTSRLLALLDDLLVYASAHDKATPSDLDLEGMIVGIVGDLQPPGGPQVVADVVGPDYIEVESMPLSTCVRNLVDNAVKYHDRPEDGTVQVTARMRHQAVEIAVVDDGPGIDPSQHEKIFQPFARLQTGGVGSGVGLSVVRRMAETFGATIELRSAVGEGSTFTVTWPARTVERPREDSPLADHDLVAGGLVVFGGAEHSGSAGRSA